MVRLMLPPLSQVRDVSGSAFGGQGRMAGDFWRARWRGRYISPQAKEWVRAHEYLGHGYELRGASLACTSGRIPQLPLAQARDAYGSAVHTGGCYRAESAETLPLAVQQHDDSKYHCCLLPQPLPRAPPRRLGWTASSWRPWRRTAPSCCSCWTTSRWGQAGCLCVLWVLRAALAAAAGQQAGGGRDGTGRMWI